MKRNYYILIALLLVFLTPLSMNAFGTLPTENLNTEKRPFAGCDGVTVVGGSGSITVSGLGTYSHIQVFTPDFASQVFNQEITTATLTVPITTAGGYVVKVWSNPNPGEFCENNFPVTVGGGGGSTLTLNGCNNASATAAAGATSAIVTYTMPTATTTCATGGATVTRTSGGASGTAFPIGTSQVCFSATDACGNTKTCCITITVTGTATSTLTLNGCNNASATAATGATSAIVTYTTPTATTTCATGGATVTRTSGGASGTAFPIGTSQVCFSATDACGNTKTCCITITVTAGGGGGTCTEYPMTDANDCAGGSWQPYSLYVAGNLYRVKDGKFRKNADGTATLTATYTTDGWSVVGTANVTFTGMTMTTPTGSPKLSSCTQGASTTGWMYYTAFSGTLTLNGQTSTMSRRGEAFQVGNGANWQNSGDFGGSGWFSLSNGQDGDFNFRLGTGVNCGGTDPCLTDAVPPVFTTCPSNINLTTTGTCANASWTAPTATDNCGTPTVAQLLGGANGSCFPLGTTLVKYMATDGKGNTAICVFNVVVTQIVIDPCATDVTPPVITCPANVVKTPTAAGTCWTVSWANATATDNCGTPTVTQTAGPVNGSCIAPGTYTVTYKAVDAKGNSATCSFTVTVNPFNACATDVTPPVITCPANVVKTPTAAGTCWTVSWANATATDNCSTPTVTQTAGPVNGSCIAPGTYTVTYKAVDAKGNSATCSFTVTVNAFNPCATDVTPPTITCPANIVKTPTAAGSCWTISWTAPTATDNCGTPTVTQTAGPTNGSCLAPGTYTVTYKAVDAKGNSATCSFTITVNAYLNCNSVTGNTIAKSCVNNIPTLTGSALANYEYVWLKGTTACPNSTTQAIAGATGQHYTLPSRVTATTYFVRCARPIGCTTWGTINESNCITVYATDCAPTVCNAPSTPSGWMYLGVHGTSHYFKYTLTGDLTCTDAKTKAQAIGGRLPVIKTSAQNAFIQSKLGTGSAWVGLRRSGNTNTWLWDNNAVATYYNWGAGEPNDYGANEDCVQIRPDGFWNDIATHAYNWCIAEVPCGGVGAYLATNDVLDMSAAAELSRARVEWINNTGYKNDFFTVEKANAVTGDFEKLEIVNNKYGTDLNEHYMVYDNNPTEGDNTYRLTVNYVDGTMKVSDVKTVNYKGLEGVRVFPNPATDNIGVDLSKYKGKAVSIYLYNQFGQQVLTHQVDKVNGETVNLDVSQHQTGNYLLRVASKGRKDVVKQVHIAK